MPSFRLASSIVDIHTESGTILACLFDRLTFIFWNIAHPYIKHALHDIFRGGVWGLFFWGVVLCLSFSWIFHTTSYHSGTVFLALPKLGYSGLFSNLGELSSLGLLVPCSPQAQVINCSMLWELPFCIICSATCLLILSTSRQQQAEAAAPSTKLAIFLFDILCLLCLRMFMGLGMSEVMDPPHSLHYQWKLCQDHTRGPDGLVIHHYIYAAQIPQCVFSGKLVIWYRSHQIFHALVLVADFVHLPGSPYFGVSVMTQKTDVLTTLFFEPSHLKDRGSVS